MNIITVRNSRDWHMLIVMSSEFQPDAEAYALHFDSYYINLSQLLNCRRCRIETYNFLYLD